MRISLIALFVMGCSGSVGGGMPCIGDEGGAGGEQSMPTSGSGGTGGEAPTLPLGGSSGEGGEGGEPVVTAGGEGGTGGQPEPSEGGAGGAPEPVCSQPLTTEQLCGSVTTTGKAINNPHLWVEGSKYCEGDTVVGFLPGQEAGCATYVFTCFGSECSAYDPNSDENLESYMGAGSWQTGTWRTTYKGDLPGATFIQCTRQGIGSCVACGPEGC